MRFPERSAIDWMGDSCITTNWKGVSYMGNNARMSRNGLPWVPAPVCRTVSNNGRGGSVPPGVRDDGGRSAEQLGSVTARRRRRLAWIDDVHARGGGHCGVCFGYPTA